MPRIRVAGGALIALMLAGCAGQGFSFEGKPQQADTAMAGRWILAAPNAPTCGMNFTGAAGARSGNVSPEGGCPGNFYLSRHWLLEQDALAINDDENNSLARLQLAGTRYEGQSVAGLTVTLTRQPTLAAPGN
jgi:Protease inhibitor Inh